MTKQIQKVYIGEIVDDNIKIVSPDRYDRYGPKAPPPDAGDFKFTRAKEVITRFDEAVPTQFFDVEQRDTVGDAISCVSISAFVALLIVLATAIFLYFIL